MSDMESSLEAIQSEGGALSDLAATLGIARSTLGAMGFVALFAILISIFAVFVALSNKAKSAWVHVIIILVVAGACLFGGYEFGVYATLRAESRLAVTIDTEVTSEPQ